MEQAMFCTCDDKTFQSKGRPFYVQINPATVTISQQNSHATKQEGGGVKQKPVYFTFLEREMSTLSAELVFNSYDHAVPEALLVSVRNLYAPLLKLLRVQSESHAPPLVLFSWGGVGFVGVVARLEEQFTMFAATGRPVRARLQIGLEGCLQEDLAATPFHSPDRTRMHTVCQRETIWDLSAKAYGTPHDWRPIAQKNGLRNPRKLTQAAALVLPPLPDGR